MSVSVSRRIDAPAGVVFAVLAEPAQHLELDGSGMLRGTDFGGRIRAVGEVFVMRMHFGPLGDYEMNNHVVELEEDRRLSWEPESGRGHPDAGTAAARWGHRWSFELRPAGPGATDVTETWSCPVTEDETDDQGEGPWRDSMTRTLDRLAELCQA